MSEKIAYYRSNKETLEEAEEHVRKMWAACRYEKIKDIKCIRNMYKDRYFEVHYEVVDYSKIFQIFLEKNTNTNVSEIPVKF